MSVLERCERTTNPGGFVSCRGPHAEEALTLEAEGLVEVVQRPSSVMARLPNPADPIARWAVLDVRP